MSAAVEVTAPARAVVYVLSAFEAGPERPDQLVVQLYRADSIRPDYTERVAWAVLPATAYGYLRQLLPTVIAGFPGVDVRCIGAEPEAGPVPAYALKALRLVLALVKRARA